MDEADIVVVCYLNKCHLIAFDLLLRTRVLVKRAGLWCSVFVLSEVLGVHLPCWAIQWGWSSVGGSLGWPLNIFETACSINVGH